MLCQTTAPSLILCTEIREGYKGLLGMQVSEMAYHRNLSMCWIDYSEARLYASWLDSAVMTVLCLKKSAWVTSESISIRLDSPLLFGLYITIESFDKHGRQISTRTQEHKFPTPLTHSSKWMTLIYLPMKNLT